MKIVHIKQKLENLNVSLENLSLGDFDRIGEYTAKKMRSPSETLYRTVGAFFRPNFERGILVYSLIRSYGLTSLLEIGTGRGFVTFCAAKAFHDMGVEGKIVTIDPTPDEKFFNSLQQVFPSEWFKMVKFIKGTSQEVVPQLAERFDLVYIDGAHDYESTKVDLKNSNDLCNKLILCDDYHLPSKDDPGIQCRQAIDEFDFDGNDFSEPEMIRGDRRIFLDDRGYTDEQINYGQMLFSKKSLGEDVW